MKENIEDKDTNLLIEKEENLEKNEEEEEEEEDKLEKKQKKEEDDDDEKKIDDEKTGLLRIVKRLETDLDSKEYDNLNQIYDKYINNEESSKKKINPNTKRCFLIFMYYVISPIFGVITLIGIFESISIMNILFEIFINSLKTYFNSLRKEYNEIDKFSIDDFNNNYNFYFKFFENVKTESYNFNLMMFFSFIGYSLLKATEFRIAIAIFGGLTVFGIFDILIFSFMDYDINDNTYSFIKIIFLLLIWILLFVVIGASSLLSHQVIIDSNVQYNEYLIKLNEEAEQKRKEINEKFVRQKTLNKKSIENDEDFKIKKPKIENENANKKDDEESEENDSDEKSEENKEETKSRFDSFFMICITSIISYLIKYFINILILGRNEDKNKEKYMNITGCGNDTICFDNIILDKNLTFTNSTLFVSLKKEIYEDSYNSFIFVGIIYASCIILSIILYSIFDCIFTKQENDDKEKKKEKENKKSEEEKNVEKKIIEDNIQQKPKLKEEKAKEKEKNIKEEENENEEKIILKENIINEEQKLKELEKKDKNEDEKGKEKKEEEEKVEKKIGYKVCEIFGCTFYCEKITLNNNPLCCLVECFLLFLLTLLDCIQLAYHSFCQYLHKMFCFCRVDDDEKLDFSNMKYVFRKNSECFCYCYQTKRFQYWIHEYLTSDIQKQIFPYMIEYFILKLLTISFEKKYFDLINNENSYPHQNSTNETNYTYFIEEYYYFSNSTNNGTNNNENGNNILKIEELYTMITFIGTFILFFYFTLSIQPIINNFKDKKKKNKLVKTMTLSSEILDGTHGLLIFNGFFTLFFSSLYLSDNNNKIFTKKYLYLVPFLMNKFYYFTLTYYCISYSEAKKKYDLISGSTLISLYLFILEIITSSIRDNSNLKSLYITQIILACLLPCLIFLFYFCSFAIYTMCTQKFSYCFIFLLCFLSHICCFGGFYWWYIENQLESCMIGENGDLKCDCEKCNCNSCRNSSTCYCCFDFLNFFKCFDCFCCKNTCCYCCVCCKCYDCCHCCSCFYCCGDSCSCDCCSHK